jgi:L-lactate dehydrogenase complex protein LldF
MDHSTRAAQFIRNEPRVHWHDQALWYVRVKRDRMAQSVPDWETLREIAAQIKAHTLSRLPDYLERFEENATRLGAKVHWAVNATEHNEIVYEILKNHGVRRVVKSKSMLTEECHLNPFLEARGIEVVDTDLGERIVQLAQEPPSHIVLPAIHKKKEEIGELFHRYLHTEKGASDPTYLTEAARGHLREKFLKADAGITGVNFAIAETGGLVICTNEGNADMGTSLPPLHIACMGFEKLIPRAQDLGVFLRLLARSATGQPITTYSAHFHGPRPGGELHIIIVDNGRSQILQKPEFRRSLSCIRCGACMNTCPVYRRSGGHSYDSVVPGPIGSILSPAQDPHRYASLPFASSLCGSCTDVCPVKIDLHHQLLAWRKELALQGLIPFSKRLTMKIVGWIFQNTWAYEGAGRLVRWMVPKLPRFILYNRWNTWGKQRELPPFPKESFREMYRKRRAQESEARSQK